MKHYYKYILFFSLILIVVSYFNSLQNVEGFTPFLKKIYRPYVRNTRIISESFIDNNKTKLVNFFRKVGIV